MARLAHVLDRIHPLSLALHGVRHLVALVASSGKFRRRRNIEHRIPIHAGIDLSRCCRRCRRRSLEVEQLAGASVDLRRVLQAIAANPDLVIRIRKIGDDEAALIVGHDDLGIFGRKILCLGNNPHARFGALVTSHLPADIVRRQVDACRGGCADLQQGGNPEASGDDLLQFHIFPFSACGMACTILRRFIVKQSDA